MNLWNKWIENFLRRSDLKGRAARGGAVLGIGAVFQRALRLGRIMVLARLLVPEDFGLVAITMMVVVMLQSVTDAGVRLSIIQNKEGANPSYLNAAWWFQSVRGLGLFLVSLIFAPFIAAFYENPILTDLLRVSFLSILINGLVSPRVHLLERELRFGKWTLLLQISVLLGTIVTIVLAYYLRSAWAIVLGTVIERFIYCLLSYILYPFRPSFEVDKNSFSELFKFAKGIFGLTILNLIARQADVFVLGKVVSPAILGSYYLALQLAEQPIGLLSNVFPRVLLPSLAALQENKSKLKSTLLSLTRGFALLGIPIAAFMAINSYEILSILYGSQYTNAGLALAILSVNIFIRLQLMLQTQTYFGLGLPHFHRRQSLKRSVLIVCLMYPAAQFVGLSGVALVLLLANTAMLIFQQYSLKRILYLKPIDFFSKWVMGVGLGALVLLPNVFLLVFKIDSPILQSVLSIGTMITVIILGFINLFKQATPVVSGKYSENSIKTM